MNKSTINNKPEEDPMKALIRETIEKGRKKKEFKKAVRKELIKSSKDSREVTNLRIKEAYKRIDTYWKQITKEESMQLEMELDTLFTFGKYKGEMLEDVIHDSPNYIEWLVENDIVSFSHEVMNYLAERKII
jgi:hypothetical protein